MEKEDGGVVLAVDSVGGGRTLGRESLEGQENRVEGCRCN
jgi:hypothetical protein